MAETDSFVHLLPSAMCDRSVFSDSSSYCQVEEMVTDPPRQPAKEKVYV